MGTSRLWLCAAMLLSTWAYAQDGGSDAGCAGLNTGCVSTRCCAGLACWGGEAAEPLCHQPELSDAGCLVSGAVCVSVELADGGSYRPTCCGADSCQFAGVAGSPQTCQPPGGSGGGTSAGGVGGGSGSGTGGGAEQGGGCHCAGADAGVLLLGALGTLGVRRRRRP
jgi:MYXO-CTERM domain-containing protein